MLQNKAREIFHSDTGIFAGMHACISRRCIGSALVLCYSAIDHLSWLNLPPGRVEVGPQDFIKFADKYVIPDSSVDCTGIDLYGARCGLLHTYTPESGLTMRGKATPIGYSWGTEPAIPRQQLQQAGAKWVMVHVETLCQAVERGALKFWSNVEGDTQKLSVVNQRAQKLLRHLVVVAETPNDLPSP